MKPKVNIKRPFFLLMLAFFLMALPSATLADTLKSNNYMVTFGNLNVTSGDKSSASYNITDTTGQVAAGPYGTYGSSDSFVGSGFQYIYQIDSFALNISDTSIELGEVEPNFHSTDSNDLTISSKGAGGYAIYAYEKHPLRHSNGTTEIADTTCDAGTCTISQAEVWTNTSVPGFGFNVSGDDAASDFLDGTYFRPFADQESADQMQVVMSSDNIANSRSATFTYKAGISGTQAAGNYETSIVYVAVPGF